MERYTINDTSGYHTDELDTLGWELTVCNMLAQAGSPCRGILEKNDTFGGLLFDYLETLFDFGAVKNALEVGGGYGFIMADLLSRCPAIAATMLDIAPFLLTQQQRTLSGFPVTYLLSDFFATEQDFLKSFDLALFNENMGDFPTVCGVEPEIFSSPRDTLDDTEREILGFFRDYGLEPYREPFNFSLGASRAVERLCRAGVPRIYLSEHSCEAVSPPHLAGKVDIRPAPFPERITLRGHDEYTLKFSHLAAIGEAHGYRVIRGSFADFIKVRHDERINFILTSRSDRDEHEIIRQFIEDLYKYEYLVLLGRGVTPLSP